MIVLTAAQTRALAQCAEAGSLRKHREKPWWYRLHAMGSVSTVARDATVQVLLKHNLVQDTGYEYIVLTEAGRKALALTPPTCGGPDA
jgi:hypothetical protein